MLEVRIEVLFQLLQRILIRSSGILLEERFYLQEKQKRLDS